MSDYLVCMRLPRAFLARKAILVLDLVELLRCYFCGRRRRRPPMQLARVWFSL